MSFVRGWLFARVLQLTLAAALSQVLSYNFPDPGIRLINGKYYAFGTNGGKGNIQAATSSDLVRSWCRPSTHTTGHDTSWGQRPRPRPQGSQASLRSIPVA